MTWKFDVGDVYPGHGLLQWAMSFASSPSSSYTGFEFYAQRGSFPDEYPTVIPVYLYDYASGVEVHLGDVDYTSGEWRIELQLDVDQPVAGPGVLGRVLINDVEIGDYTFNWYDFALDNDKHFGWMRLGWSAPYVVHFIDEFPFPPPWKVKSATASAPWFAGWPSTFDQNPWDPEDFVWDESMTHPTTNGTTCVDFTVLEPVQMLQPDDGEFLLRRFRHGRRRYEARQLADAYDWTGESAPYAAYETVAFWRAGKSKAWAENADAPTEWIEGDELYPGQSRVGGHGTAHYHRPTETLTFRRFINGDSVDHTVAGPLREGTAYQMTPYPNGFCVELADGRWWVGTFLPHAWREWVAEAPYHGEDGDAVWGVLHEQSIGSGACNFIAPSIWYGRDGRQAVVGYQYTDAAFYVLTRGGFGKDWEGPYLDIGSAVAYRPYIVEWEDGTWEVGWYSLDGFVQYAADSPRGPWSLVS